jgi:hypothetical protein
MQLLILYIHNTSTLIWFYVSAAPVAITRRWKLLSCWQSQRNPDLRHKLTVLWWNLYTVKKLSIFLSPGGKHWPNSPWPGIIKFFPVRESLVSDIPPGDGKIYKLFLQCRVLYTASELGKRRKFSDRKTIYKPCFSSVEFVISKYYTHNVNLYIYIRNVIPCVI